MDWSGKKNDAAATAIFVSLPDAVVDGEAFSFAVGGNAAKTRGQAFWHRAFRVLSIVEGNGLERNLRVRATTATRYEGDAETQVAMDYMGAGSRGIESFAAGLALHAPGQKARGRAEGAQNSVLRSQITGKILKILVKPGDRVAVGDALLIIEAMKMENRVFAPSAGTVKSVHVKEGDAVQTGRELVKLERG